MARNNPPVETSFVMRITFTGRIRTLIDRSPPGERPPEAVRCDLLDALSALDSLLGGMQPKKDNVWVFKDTPGTLHVKYDTQEGSKVHNTIINLKRHCGGSKALFDNPISYLAVYELSVHSSDVRLLFALKRPTLLHIGSSTPTYALPSSCPPAITQSTSSLPIGFPILPVRVSSTAQYNAVSTLPLSTIPPPLPRTHVGTAIENQNNTIGTGADRPTSVTRDPRIRAASNTGVETSASLASAGKPSAATRNNSLPAKPPLLAIKIRTPKSASNSKSSGSINASKSASPASPQSSSNMSTSTSGCIIPASIRPISSGFLPARHFTEPPPGTGRSAETAVSSTVVTPSAHGNQMLQSFSALPVAGPLAKPANSPVSVTAKMPTPAFGQSAFGLPPAAIGTLGRSESNQHGKPPPTLGGAPAGSTAALAPSSSGTTPVASKAASAPSEAEKRAKSKRLFFDMQKTLDLERTKHAEGLDAIKKRHAEDLEAEQTKHTQQLRAAKEEHAQKLAEAQVQWAEEARTLQTQRIELQKAVKSAEEAVAAMKQQVADISQQAEMKAAELRKTYQKQLIEKVAKTRQELELTRRDADARGKEVAGMKRKTVEIAGRLVRMRTEGAMSPARVTAEQNEGDIISTVSSLETYIEGMRSMLQSEISSRQALERELRILKDVDRENKEPFVVPALLEAFVRLAKLGEDSEDGRR